jgi:hypothetical protein
MREGIVACASMIFGLILLFVAFLGPLYTINGSGAFRANYNVGLYLTRMEVQGLFADQDVMLSMNYAEAKVNARNTGVNVGSFAAIDAAMYLTLLAMVTALISIICVAAFVFNKGKPKTMKLMGGFFGILTFLFTLLPALYFMFTGFVENSSGFWFSLSALDMTLSAGPGYAWYLMIVVAIIAVISAVAILLKKIVPEAASPKTLLRSAHK